MVTKSKCTKSQSDFIEGSFETEIIIKDSTKADLKKADLKKIDVPLGTDPINLAESQINEIFIPIPVITPTIYQEYLNGTLLDHSVAQYATPLGVASEPLALYIKNNYYFYQNKWPTIKEKDNTIFKLPPPFVPKQPILIE